MEFTIGPDDSSTLEHVLIAPIGRPWTADDNIVDRVMSECVRTSRVLGPSQIIDISGRKYAVMTTVPSWPAKVTSSTRFSSICRPACVFSQVELIALPCSNDPPCFAKLISDHLNAHMETEPAGLPVSQGEVFTTPCGRRFFVSYTTPEEVHGLIIKQTAIVVYTDTYDEFRVVRVSPFGKAGEDYAKILKSFFRKHAAEIFREATLFTHKGVQFLITLTSGDSGEARVGLNTRIQIGDVIDNWNPVHVPSAIRSLSVEFRNNIRVMEESEEDDDYYDDSVLDDDASFWGENNSEEDESEEEFDDEFEDEFRRISPPAADISGPFESFFIRRHTPPSSVDVLGTVFAVPISSSHDLRFDQITDGIPVSPGACFETSLGAKVAVLDTEPTHGGLLGPCTRINLNSSLVAHVLPYLRLVVVTIDERCPVSIRQSARTYISNRLTKSRGGFCVVYGASITTDDGVQIIPESDEGEWTCGVVSSATHLDIELKETDEYEEVHIMPYIETLPMPMDAVEIFEKYLAPLFEKQPLLELGRAMHFTQSKVHFKIVSVFPDYPRARVGLTTKIRCDGTLKFHCPEVVTPELLDQLSRVPNEMELLFPSPDELIRWERLMVMLGGIPKRKYIRRPEIFDEIKSVLDNAYLQLLHEYMDFDLTKQPMHIARMLERFTDLIFGYAVRPGNSADVWLNWLPIEEYRDEDTEECIICATNYKHGDKRRRLPCGHKFHAPCVDKWLARSCVCPLCKVDIEEVILKSLDKPTHDPSVFITRKSF
jgi:hypothetical protein